MAVVTLTATPQLDTVPPRVRLDITATGTPTVTAIVVSRQDPDGRTRPVRTSNDGPMPVSGGVATLYDYEAPYGAPVTYSTNHTSNPTATITVNVTEPWLIHPGVPSRSVPIRATVMPDRKRTTDRTVFQVLNRPDPIVVTSGARSTPAGILGVRTTTDAARRALDLLLDDNSVLFLNVPPSKGWGVDTSYVSIGDVTEARTVRWGGFPYREWELPYVIVGRPAGGTQAAITWNDIAAKYATWQAIVDAGVPSWAELAAPTT